MFDNKQLDTLIEQEISKFAQKTNASGLLWQEGEKYMPAGTPTSLQYFEPWPLAIEKSNGSYAWDVDGNKYADYHNGFSTMVMGHTNSLITNAIKDAADNGTMTGFLCSQAVEFAEVICRFNLERVQFANSGMEATALAIRIARAVTGKEQIVKIEGCYHGLYDSLMVSTHPSIREAGDSIHPDSVLWGKAVPKWIKEQTIVCPFNNLQSIKEVFEDEKTEIACLILEPVMLNVGFVQPLPGYLQGLRELCDQFGVILIFDEVKTAITIAYGGAEEVYGVKPDLKALGKGLGGGIAASAVGGKKELMMSIENGDTPHYSTFAGNPLAMKAGLIALRDVLTPDTYKHIAELNNMLLRGMNSILRRFPHIPAYTVLLGAKGNILFTDPPYLKDYRDWETRVDHDYLGFLYWICMVNQGVLLSPGQDEQWTMSITHTEEEIKIFLKRFEYFCNLVHSAYIDD